MTPGDVQAHAATVRYVLPSKSSTQTTVMALPEEWRDAHVALDALLSEIERLRTELHAANRIIQDDNDRLIGGAA